MKRWWTLLGVLCLLAPAAAQDEPCPLPTRLSQGDTAHVLLADGDPLNVRKMPGLGNTPATQITRSRLVTVVTAPVCADNIVWLNVESPDVSGWIAEGDEGEYYVSPANYLANWTWNSEEEPTNTLDPVGITLPMRYAGNMPSLPVDLSAVQYIDDAALNEAQLTLLAKNGFVVVPADNERFHGVYRGWGTSGGMSMGEVDENGLVINPIPPNFITTDAMLNVLYDVFHQLLVELEKATFSPAAQTMLANTTVEALAQYEALKGTSLEAPARDTLVYLGLAYSS